jgi:hypothetical protein
MARSKRNLSGINYKSKVEKQVNLPKVYTKLPKTERMVNLPRIYYNKNKYKAGFSYKITGNGLIPDINDLRFYDIGLINNQKPIYYDETDAYQLVYNGFSWTVLKISNNLYYWWQGSGPNPDSTPFYPSLSTLGSFTISKI